MSQTPPHHPSPESGGRRHLSTMDLPPLCSIEILHLLLYSYVKPGTIVIKKCLNTYEWLSMYEHIKLSGDFIL